MTQKGNKNSLPWNDRDEYEDFVFREVMRIYCEKKSKKILEELENEKGNEEIDMGFIEKLLNEKK